MADTKSEPRAPRTPSKNVDQNTIAWKVVNEKLGGLARIHKTSIEAAKQGKIDKPIPTSSIWGWVRRGQIPRDRTNDLIIIGGLMSPKVNLKMADFGFLGR